MQCEPFGKFSRKRFKSLAHAYSARVICLLAILLAITWLSDYPHALQCSSDLFISYFISYAQFHQENSQGLTISSVVSWLWIMLPVKCVDGFGYLAGEFYVFLSSQVTSCFRVNFTWCQILTNWIILTKNQLTELTQFGMHGTLKQLEKRV